MTLPENVSVESVRKFWDANPVAMEAITHRPGTREFFEAFDRLREAEDCEPPGYSEFIHGYSSSQNKRILDVGCGNGCVLSRYARHGADVHGVDLSGTAVELSRKRFELHGLNGTFTRIDGTHLPYPDSHFDIVCSMGVLHHIPDPRPSVEEIYRALKPGGTFIGMLYYHYSYKYMVLFRLKRLFDPRYRGMSQQEALNMNDGRDCPLAIVYTRREVMKLLERFENPEFHLNQLTYRQLFLLPPLVRLAGRLLPSPSDTWLAHWLGWSLYFNARKPQN